MRAGRWHSSPEFASIYNGFESRGIFERRAITVGLKLPPNSSQDSISK